MSAEALSAESFHQQVGKILTDALSMRNDDYVYTDERGEKFIRWGRVESAVYDVIDAGYKAGADAMAETCAKACDKIKIGARDDRAYAEALACQECAQACRNAARGKP